MNVSKEQREKRIAALLRERDGYRRVGKLDRAKQVDDQLELYGYVDEARKLPPQGRSEVKPPVLPIRRVKSEE